MFKRPPKIKACYFLGLTGIIGAVVFLSIMLSLDIIQFSSNPIIKTISEMVYGPYGWLQNLAFILLAFWFIIFVSRLYSVMKKRLSSVIGTSSLAVTSIGFFMITLFPAQVGGLEQTIQGLVHNSFAGIISASFLIGCIAFAFHFRRDPKWQRYWGFTIMTVLLCLTFALLWALLPREWHMEGVGERLFLTSGMVWVMVISIRLMQLCRQSQETVAVPIETDKEPD